MKPFSPSKPTGWSIAVVFAVISLFLTRLARAQPGDMSGMSGEGAGGMAQCPMMDMMTGMGGGWMIAGMIVFGMLLLATIAVLAALALFLVRRSRPATTGTA